MQDEFMTPEQWAKAIRKSVVTSTAIETGRSTDELYRILDCGRYSYLELHSGEPEPSTVRCRTCHGTGSDGWQACQDCNGSGQVDGVFEPYD